MAERKTDWLTLGLLLAMYALLAGNVALYRRAPLPLVVHVLIGAAAIHLAFTIWHEAVHRNVSPRLWVNRVVGVLGMFPYMTPYFMQRWIHLEHHARLNERPTRTSSTPTVRSGRSRCATCARSATRASCSPRIRAVAASAFRIALVDARGRRRVRRRLVVRLPARGALCCGSRRS